MLLNYPTIYDKNINFKDIQYMQFCSKIVWKSYRKKPSTGKLHNSRRRLGRHIWVFYCKKNPVKSVPILDFWEPYAKLCRRRGGGGGGGGGCDERMECEWWNVFVRFTPSRIALTESAWEAVSLPRLGALSTGFFFFLSSKRLYDIHVTWFDWFLRREGDSAPH